jgi:hypothetical protein
MSLLSIVGVTGRKFNGKDTVGKILSDRYGYIRVAFADSLKEACRSIFHFTDEQLYGKDKEVIDEYWKIAPRHIFQFVGTELFREQISRLMPWVEKNIWIKSVEKQIQDIKDKNKDARIVVTDVRFQNEVDAVRKLGGIVIRVKRPSLKDDTDTHSSELEIDELDVDIDIINDSSVDDLRDRVINIFK